MQGDADHICRTMVLAGMDTTANSIARGATARSALSPKASASINGVHRRYSTSRSSLASGFEGETRDALIAALKRETEEKEERGKGLLEKKSRCYFYRGRESWQGSKRCSSGRIDPGWILVPHLPDDSSEYSFANQALPAPATETADSSSQQSH